MIKLTGFLILSLSILASLADLSSGNETVLHKTRRNHKKDDKQEYYLNRHVDHPDVDAETIQKHGASLEDAKMQADGLLEPMNKKVKTFDPVESKKGEETEGKLQEMVHGEEKQHQRRRHHRHEVKVHEVNKSEKTSGEDEIPKKEEIKEKKLIKSRKVSETSKFEDVKPEDGSKNTETSGGVKHTGGKRNHEKRRKGHKHGGNPGHKNKKHGGKKSHKPLGKPTKEKKIFKPNHQN